MGRGFRREEFKLTISSFAFNNPLTHVRSFIVLSQVFEEVGELLIYVWRYYFKFIRQAHSYILVNPISQLENILLSVSILANEANGQFDGFLRQQRCTLVWIIRSKFLFRRKKRAHLHLSKDSKLIQTIIDPS